MMRNRHLLVGVVVAVVFSTACSLSLAPQSAPLNTVITPTRPQSSFIDARDVVQTPVATPEIAQAQSVVVVVVCTPRYDWVSAYQVQRGDTLSSIAARAGTSAQVLAQGNCINDPNLIYAGELLRVPQPVRYQPSYYPHQPQSNYPPPNYPPNYPPHQPPPHQPPPHQPPPHYPTPTYAPPTYIPPTHVPPPVVIGSGLSIAPYISVNNNTFILPPDQLVTFSWIGTFPATTDRVVFELVPPGESSGQAIGLDTNLGNGASIIWRAVAGTQGTLRAVAYFQGGYPPQTSDSYYIIAGNP